MDSMNLQQRYTLTLLCAYPTRISSKKPDVHVAYTFHHSAACYFERSVGERECMYEWYAGGGG